MAFSPLRLMPRTTPARNDDPDAALLTRFVEQRDEAAFAELLRRHGPLVWGVCRRAMSNPADAEDAFQATFLVLFQRAHRIAKRTSLASWLHGVAWRVARRVRNRAARRREVVMIAEAVAKEPGAEVGISHILDAEIRKLPARYREPVILCHLQGHSHAAAAQTLGCPIGTIAGRLSRARELLRTRLLRRSIAPALAAAWCSEAVSTPLPATLMQRTLQSLASPATAILQLAKGVIVTMTLTRSLLVGIFTVGVTLALGTGYAAYALWEHQPAQEKGVLAKDNPDKLPHPDYSALQGQWRYEHRNRVTQDLIHYEDLFFKGREYVLRITENRGSAGLQISEENQPTRFELHPEHNPKRIDLRLKYVDQMMEGGPKFRPGGDYNKPPGEPILNAVQLSLYTLEGDELRIQPGGFAPLKRKADGNYYIDRDVPTATYPRNFGEATKIYRRISPVAAKPNRSQPGNVSAQEKKLLDERIQNADEVLRLRWAAYRAGKETVDFLLNSIQHRLKVNLDRDGGEPVKKRAALQEAFDVASEAEKAANAKYQAGSATLLELLTVKQVRLDLELQLVRAGK